MKKLACLFKSMNIRAQVLFLCALSVFSHSTFADDRTHLASTVKYDVTAPSDYKSDISHLKSLLDDVIAQFEAKVTPLKGKLTIAIEPEACLRVGYSFSKAEVDFCAVKNVIQDGLASDDVIRHEVFHAMVCNVRPDICSETALSSDDVTATHEALADFFAYQFQKDDCFGENFYKAQQCVRHYRSDFCYSLVSGVHEKGNALESQLISADISLEKMAPTILQGAFLPSSILKSAGLPTNTCFAQLNPPQIATSVSNYPASELNKYWIAPSLALILQFTPNAAMNDLYKNASIHWIKDDGTSSSLFQITQTQGQLGFSISPSASKGIEKVVAQIYDGTHLIGDLPFYLGIKSGQP